MGKTNKIAVPKQKTRWNIYFKRHWQLYAMVALPLVYLLIFKYLPMRYIILAFKEYKLNTPLTEMPWANVKGNVDYFKYFKMAFGNVDFRRAL